MQLHMARVQPHLRSTTNHEHERCSGLLGARARTRARDTHRNMHIARLYVYGSVTLPWDNFLCWLDTR